MPELQALKIGFLLDIPTSMPDVTLAGMAEMTAESERWDRRTTMLYRQYLMVMVMAVVACGGVLFLTAQPMLASLLGNAYLFGSDPV